MCGIVGVFDWSGSAVCAQEMGMFMQMLHTGAVRGMHGTGVFAVDRDGGNFRMRVGGPPHELVASPDFGKFEKWVSGHYTRFLVGHNRYATRGNHTTEHTHPFRDGDITLIHNGTLDDEWKKVLPDAKKYEVDSEAICHAISVQGPEKTITSLRGAWALVWWDHSAQKIFMIRNKERPLWIARREKQNQIFFASEVGMLSWILTRNELHEFKIEELAENQLVSYGLDSMKPHVKELKGKSAFFSDVGWQGYGGHSRGEAAGSGKSQVESDTKIVQLPLLSSPKSAKKNGGNTAKNTDSTDRGSLPQKTNAGGTATTNGKGYWVTADSIHDITKKSRLVVWPIESHAVKDEVFGDLFVIKAMDNDHPDVDFFCHIRGAKNVDSIMEATHGMKADVKNITRSMSLVARFPHRVFLHNPEPLYMEEPEVPVTAHTGT
jgi:hypothetical protein